MTETVQVTGLREVERALSEMPKATGKNVLRRVLKRRAQPVADAMSANAPRLSGDLAESAAVSTKLTKRQRAQHRKMFKNDKASVEMFVGMGGLAQATQQEFGNERHPPQPFTRPAWDQNKTALLEGLKADLWTEIEKAAARMAKKAAKGR